MKGRTKATKFMSAMLIALSLMNTFPFSSYAGWERYEDSWRYYDDSGDYRTGDFIDEDGNIYFLESDGKMVRNKQSTYFRYYGDDGALVNNRADPDGKLKDLSLRYLINGEQLRFTSYDEMIQWWAFFNNYYNDYDMFEDVYYCSDGPYYTVNSWQSVLEWYYGKEMPPQSELVQSTVKELASKVTGDTIREKVVSAGKVVGDFIDYDYDMLEKERFVYGLESVITSRKGICLAYSMLTERVLREVGIEAEQTGGTLVYQSTPEDGNYSKTDRHSWLRINLNQGTTNSVKWMYSDPTFYDSSKSETRERYLDYDYYNMLFFRRMEGMTTGKTEKGKYYSQVY